MVGRQGLPTDMHISANGACGREPYLHLINMAHWTRKNAHNRSEQDKQDKRTLDNGTNGTNGINGIHTRRPQMASSMPVQ